MSDMFHGKSEKLQEHKQLVPYSKLSDLIPSWSIKIQKIGISPARNQCFIWGETPWGTHPNVAASYREHRDVSCFEDLRATCGTNLSDQDLFVVVVVRTS